MADIKISDLAAAANATAGQQLEVNDGGVSRRITVDQIKTYVGAQPADATLTALAGVTTAADRVPYFTGVDNAATTTLTTFGRSLIDDASAADARTTLGLGTLATQNTVTGLTVSQGGTGASTFTSGSYLKGNGTSAITAQSGIPATDITSGTIATARLGSGTANNTTFLRGDNTWQAVSTSVTTSQVLSATAGLTAGDIGSYAYAADLLSGSIAFGSTRAGSSLYPCGVVSTSWSSTALSSGSGGILHRDTALTGTWRCLGRSLDASISENAGRSATLWLRIS